MRQIMVMGADIAPVARQAPCFRAWKDSAVCCWALPITRQLYRQLGGFVGA